MKKIFLLAVMLIMSTCFLLPVVGCNQDPDCAHEWQDTSARTEPTCTVAGTQVQKCTKCDGIQTVEIPALGHAFAETWTVDENGHWHICTRDNCTAKSDEVNHVDENKNHACDVCEKVVSDCADEDNNHKCDTCGQKLSDCADEDNNHKCDTCGQKLSDCADEDNNHKCDTCGEKLSDCADEDNNHKCDTCGATVSDHTGGTATCQQKAVCTICEQEYGNLAAHDYEWIKGKDGHYRRCKTENCTEEEPLTAHTFKDGICSSCGDYDVYGTEDLSFAYYVRDQYYEVKKYRGSETDIVIPYYYDDGTTASKW